MSAPRLQLLGLRLGHAIESLQQLACCTRRRTRQAYAQYLLRELRELQAEAIALQLTIFDDDDGDDDELDGGRDAELLAAVVDPRGPVPNGWWKGARWCSLRSTCRYADGHECGHSDDDDELDDDDDEPDGGRAPELLAAVVGVDACQDMADNAAEIARWPK